jgi:hypothetical protein
MEIVGRYGIRWPDRDTGPLKAWITIGVIKGRPEVVGVELWAADPSSLAKQVTGLTPTQAERHWVERAEWSPIESDELIRSKDLRFPLAKLVTEIIGIEARQSTPFAIAMRAKARQSLNPSRSYKDKPPFGLPRERDRAKRVTELANIVAPKKRGRPRSRSLEDYEEVARVYTKALRSGLSPVKAVRDALGGERAGASKSLASKLIYDCRRPPLNLLPPTRQGVAAS